MQAADVYLTFNVKSQLGTKASTSVVSADSESLSWLTEVLDLEVLEPINAILEVFTRNERGTSKQKSLKQQVCSTEYQSASSLIYNFRALGLTALSDREF